MRRRLANFAARIKDHARKRGEPVRAYVWEKFGKVIRALRPKITPKIRLSAS